MMPDQAAVVEFVPSRSEGLADVTLVRFEPYRLTVVTGGAQKSFAYADFAQWPRPALVWRSLWRLGWRRTYLPVGERHWSVDHQAARIRFFTKPSLTIWMPEAGHRPYGTSPWRRIQERLGASGFATWDMT